VADLAGAEHAVQAVFSALRLRERHGRGQRLEVSIAHAATGFGQPFRHGLTAPGGPLDGSRPGYSFYRANNGWIALAALEPQFLARVESSLGITASREALTVVFATESCRHWQDWADEHDIPLTFSYP